MHDRSSMTMGCSVDACEPRACGSSSIANVPARRVRSGCIAAALLPLLLAACGGGSGEGLDANGRPVDEGGGGALPLAPTWASLQQNVFTPACTGCHAGASAPQGLRLDAANSYAMLVGVSSSEVPSLLRVAPGDPGASYLVQKLEGSAAVGARMPLGGPYLDATTIAAVRDWITAGALPPEAQP